MNIGALFIFVLWISCGYWLGLGLSIYLGVAGWILGIPLGILGAYWLMQMILPSPPYLAEMADKNEESISSANILSWIPLVACLSAGLLVGHLLRTKMIASESGIGLEGWLVGATLGITGSVIITSWIYSINKRLHGSEEG